MNCDGERVGEFNQTNMCSFLEINFGNHFPSEG